MFKKKGDPTDMFMLLIIIFYVAVSLVVTIYANHIIHDVISTTALNESSAYSSIDASFTDIQDYSIQQGFVLFYGILIIGIIISSFLIRVHPVFIFVYIITLAVCLFVAVYLANTYAILVDNPLFSAISDKYTMMTWVMSHVIQILLAVGALSMIIIFGKIGGGEQNPF